MVRGGDFIFTGDFKNLFQVCARYREKHSHEELLLGEHPACNASSVSIFQCEFFLFDPLTKTSSWRTIGIQTHIISEPEEKHLVRILFL